MKVIIAGGRDLADTLLVRDAIKESSFEITEVVSGGAQGVDLLGEKWALQNSVPCRVFRADWDTWGKAAGPLRNQQMADYADALIAVWDGVSKGTGNMIKTAQDKGLEVYVKRIDGGLFA